MLKLTKVSLLLFVFCTQLTAQTFSIEFALPDPPTQTFLPCADGYEEEGVFFSTENCATFQGEEILGALSFVTFPDINFHLAIWADDMLVDMSAYDIAKIEYNLFSYSQGGYVEYLDADMNVIDAFYTQSHPDLPNFSFNNEDANLKFIKINNINEAGNQSSNNLGDLKIWTTDECLPPSQLYTTNPTETTADISFAAVNLATKYKIKYRIVGSGNSWTVLNSNSPSFSLSGLSPGSEYQYKIKSKCPDGWTAFYETKTFNTISEPCDIPTNTYFKEPSSSKVKVGFTNMADAEKYRIRIREVGTIEWLIKSSNNNKKTFDTTPNTSYEFEFAAKCGGVWTAYGNLATFTTGDLCPAPNLANVEVFSDFSNVTHTVTWNTEPSADTYKLRIIQINFQTGEPLPGATWLTFTDATPSFTFGGNPPLTVQIRNVCELNSDWVQLDQLPIIPQFQEGDIDSRSMSNSNDNLLKLFPNPANNQINIQLGDIEARRIDISDLNGKVFHTKELVNGNQVINTNIDHLFQGIYLVRIRDKQGEIFVEKFVKF